LKTRSARFWICRKTEVVDLATQKLAIELSQLERQLWAFESRYNVELMDSLLAPDFVEFGRSGKVYTRKELLTNGEGKRTFNALIHQYDVRLLAPAIALATYVSELQAGGVTERANRSSIWDRTSGDWKLRFHQGTTNYEETSP